MLTIFLLFIIAGSLAGAGLIVVPKFPLVANLDLDHLPMEREARKKRELLQKRIVEEGKQAGARWWARLEPLRRLWGRAQLAFRIYVGKIERLWQHEQVAKVIGRRAPGASGAEEKVDKLVHEGKLHLEHNRLEQAEEAFIAAIKIDKRSFGAYRGLADTYLAQGSLPEARETYKFLVQRTPEDDGLHIKLSEIAEAEGNIEEAITHLEQAVILNDSLSARFYHLAELLLSIKQPETAREAILSAVELEPKNPKYLDLLVETGILVSDKDLARKAYEELRLVNPDNQKLASFKERIEKIV